jgi:hypothetical protein
MRTAGLFLALLGATHFLFPLIGRTSWILTNVFGQYERIGAIGCLAVGAVLFGLSFRKKKEEKK